MRLLSFVKSQFQIRRGQVIEPSFRPLHQQDGFGVIEVPDGQVLQFLGILDPVQIQMKNGHTARLIGLQQAVTRALDVTRVTQRVQEGTGKSGFACAEISLEKNHQGRANPLRKESGQNRNSCFIRYRPDPVRITAVPAARCGHVSMPAMVIPAIIYPVIAFKELVRFAGLTAA